MAAGAKTPARGVEMQSVRDKRWTGWLLGVCLFAAASAGSEEFTAAVKYVPSGHILSVYHGGGDERIVVAGVECPQSTTQWGQAAKKFTSEHVAEQSVGVNVVKRVGNLVYAQVTLPDGTDLGEQLLSDGLATCSSRFVEPSAAYQAAEQQARDQRVGQWAATQDASFEVEMATTFEGRWNQRPEVGAFRDTEGQLHLKMVGEEESTAHEDAAAQRGRFDEMRAAYARELREREAIERERQHELELETIEADRQWMYDHHWSHGWPYRPGYWWGGHVYSSPIVGAPASGPSSRTPSTTQSQATPTNDPYRSKLPYTWNSSGKNPYISKLPYTWNSSSSKK